MGKWSAFHGILPKYVKDEKYQAKVDARKIELAEQIPMEPASLARSYCIARLASDEQKRVLYDKNLDLEAIKQMLADVYDSQGITNLKLDNDVAIRVQEEPQAKVYDKEANRLWAIKEGLEKSLALPWPTLNALMKSALEQGLEYPDGTQATMRTKVVPSGLKGVISEEENGD